MSGLSKQIARSILTGFERHFSFFQEISSAARQRFERADWESVRLASAKRISFYDMRVKETTEKVSSSFDIFPLHETLWREVKDNYVKMLSRHSRPELAETFYNSVFCRLFVDREYYNDEMIFVESMADRRELIEHYRVYMSFHPKDGGLENSIWEILSTFYFNIPYANISQDTENIAVAFRERSRLSNVPTDDLRIDVLESPFYRNKAAYIIGRVVDGDKIEPFVIPLLNNEHGAIYADTLLTEVDQIKAVFSFARAYFMVKTPVPVATVDFLQSLMPDKTLADLYMSIGLHKQAKNEFYRDLLNHLHASSDQFTVAPGIRGLVMLVFTLPSFPYVFKVIRDKFAPQKDVTPQVVKQRYLQVKMHDRVGRMADTLEYSDVALPLDRFSAELLEEIEAAIPSKLTRENGNLVIRHLYIEKRMAPLDLYLNEADEEDIESALYDWGLAIKQLMAVNIFPGDLLFKNFGVTRQGKVVFYDYDEICYLTECNFRKIPPPRTPEDEMSAEPWYSIGANDIFPEEFPIFLSTNPKIRQQLIKLHPDLFDFTFWQQYQEEIKNGLHADISPYSSKLRFPQHQPDTVPVDLEMTA